MRQTDSCDHQADSGELAVGRGAVLGRIVREDCGAVKGAVALREVQPALEAKGTLTSQSNAHNVR